MIFMNEHKLSIDDAFRRPFARALAWVIGGGAVALAAMIFFINQIDAALLNDAIVIAMFSVMIACLAMLPGLLVGRCSDGILVNLMAGIPIRLVGTVALFLACRYHMASPSEAIAVITISWYLLLTSIEVLVLVRQSPGLAESRSLVSGNSAGESLPKPSEKLSILNG